MSGCRVFAALSASVMLGMACAAHAQAPGDAAVLEEASAETTIGATMSETNRMLAQVTIAGAGPYPFIIDTAAERSVIARELASELGLAPAGRARLLSMTSSREAAMVRVPDMSFAPGQSRTLQAFALNGRHVGASGVLGIDALRGQRVVLDFEAGEMRVGPATRNAERLGPNDIVVRARSRYGQLVLIDSSAEGVDVEPRAACVAIQHLPGVGTEQPAQHTQQRRLSRSAFADDGDDLARKDVERHAIQRGHAPEAQGEFVGGEERAHSAASWLGGRDAQ